MSSSDKPRHPGTSRVPRTAKKKVESAPALPASRLTAARGAGLVIIRVVGSGNLLLAPSLQEFFEEERHAGFRRFVFDLGECRGMDSTFMGCMVGMYTALKGDSGRWTAVSSQDPEAAVHASAAAAAEEDEADDSLEALSPEEALKVLRSSLSATKNKTSPDPSPLDDGFITAVNVTEECREVMNILGVDRFVKIVGAFDLSGLEVESLPVKDMGSNERRELILKAHENLVEIDKRNEAQFGAFLRTLSDELAKSRSDKPPG